MAEQFNGEGHALADSTVIAMDKIYSHTAALIPGSRPLNGFNWTKFKLSQERFLKTRVLKAMDSIRNDVTRQDGARSGGTISSLSIESLGNY